MKKFSILNIFKLAWEDFLKNWKKAFLLTMPIVIIGIISGLFGIESSAAPDDSLLDLIYNANYLQLTISILSFFAATFFAIILIRSFLKIVDQKNISIKKEFRTVPKIKNYFGFIIIKVLIFIISAIPSLIYFIITTSILSKLFPENIILPSINILFLIIIFSIIFASIQFAYYFILEDKSTIWKSIAKSWNISKGNRIKLLYVFILFFIFIVIPVPLWTILSNYFLQDSSVILYILTQSLPIFIWLFFAMTYTSFVSLHLYRILDPEAESRK